MNGRPKYFVLVLMLILPMVGCSADQSGSEDAGTAAQKTESKPVIAATNFALESMAKEIVGGYADVIRPQVQDAANGLNLEEVVSMQNAAVVLTNGPGADDAAWLNLISLNESRVHATTSDEFELEDFIQVEDYRTVHSHGDEGEHSHPWLVPHCWLNPKLAQAQSLSVLNRLIEVFPGEESTFTANHRSLKQELGAVEELAGEVAELLQSKKIRVMASDPRLLFFTRSLKLDDDYFLWFEMPEISEAIAELKKRKPKGQQKLLLLWAQRESSGSFRKSLADSTETKIVPVSLMEEAGSAGSSSAREYTAALRDNYQVIKTAIEGMTD